MQFNISYVILKSFVRHFVCHSYVIRMFSYVTRMSIVCHSYVLACHPYVTRMWFYHELKVSIIMSQNMNFIMLQRVSFVMSQKRSIFMSQKVNFIMSQKLNNQFVTNSEFFHTRHVIHPSEFTIQNNCLKK